MRTVCLSVLILITFTIQAQKNTPFDSTLWKTNYEKALSEASSRNLPLVMVFSGSDWCKPCIKLHENVLVTPRFSAWAKDSVVLLSIDFPRQKKNALPSDQTVHNDRIAEQFNPGGVFPLVLVITAEGSVKGQLTYHDELPDQFITQLNQIINPTQP